MQRELHFFESHDDAPDSITLHGYKESMAAIRNRLLVVYTTQMCLLSGGGSYLADGWRIFIHPQGGYVPYEILIGGCDVSGNPIRQSCNFYDMWANGLFPVQKAYAGDNDCQ